jgi:hypothetical protein
VNRLEAADKICGTQKSGDWKEDMPSDLFGMGFRLGGGHDGAYLTMGKSPEWGEAGGSRRLKNTVPSCRPDVVDRFRAVREPT